MDLTATAVTGIATQGNAVMSQRTVVYALLHSTYHPTVVHLYRLGFRQIIKVGSLPPPSRFIPAMAERNSASW